MSYSEMVAAIETQSETIHGGDAKLAAAAWIDAGFTAESASDWWDAYCFDAEATAEMRDAGISPADAALETEMCGQVRSLGYWFCQGQLEIAGLKERIELERDDFADGWYAIYPEGGCYQAFEIRDGDLVDSINESEEGSHRAGGNAHYIPVHDAILANLRFESNEDCLTERAHERFVSTFMPGAEPTCVAISKLNLS